jgi:hypothetical protein
MAFRTRARFNTAARIISHLVMALSASPVFGQVSELDKLVKAYPDFLTGHNETQIEWKDGSRMAVSDGKLNESYDDRLKSATILDQMLLPYPKGPLAKPPALEDDPGRFRNAEFFDKMYGNCDKGETQKKLVTLNWLPNAHAGVLKVTSVNGVVDRLRDVSAEIDRLPMALKKFAFPSAGTFNCRVVKDTGNRSMHAWGAAIDLNTKFSDYWLWSKGKSYRNRMPMEIVEIFERHGFIWGGKWGHYDTMHFEYRPELL